MGLFFHPTISHKSLFWTTETTKLQQILARKFGVKIKLQQKFEVFLKTTKTNVWDCFSICITQVLWKREQNLNRSPLFNKKCLKPKESDTSLGTIKAKVGWYCFALYIIQITPWKTGKTKFTRVTVNPFSLKNLGFKPIKVRKFTWNH